MLGRSDVFRAAAIVALIAVAIVSLVVANRHPASVVIEALPVAPIPTSDNLSVELRRCSALGPQDAEDPHCVAVWEESRQRFFGRPARPLPTQTQSDAAASATPLTGDAR